MFRDLISKLSINKNSKFVLERLMDFNNNCKIHIKNKNCIYYIGLYNK